MAKIAMVVYNPRKGMSKELIDSLQANIPVMRKLGLVTSRDQIIAQAKDGSIIQIFEWIGEDSEEKAMAHPVIQEMWMEVSKISDFKKPSAVAEFNEQLSKFDTIY